ncbi:hypothetical protein U0070_025358 [Myodes glareolus]|uniref:Actin interacting protein 3-like C-terminal domain-containing protein n=1 Tax=Myodes glareolus TaxID=447135 RepID=A0AAW0JMS5_MYOGA
MWTQLAAAPARPESVVDMCISRQLHQPDLWSSVKKQICSSWLESSNLGSVREHCQTLLIKKTNPVCQHESGVLYLQYGDETKQLRMPNEITSADTIRALFVSAFPQQLTMKMLESPSVAIYIKDESRNVYYELNDVRNIQDRSLLKVYNKDPSHAFNHMAKAVNGDVRGMELERSENIEFAIGGKSSVG